MGVLGPIVLPQPLLMRAGQAQVPESRSVGAALVGSQQFRRETLFLEELAHQPECRPLVAPALNQHVENLTLVIDGTPQVHSLSGDPDHDLVEVHRSLGRGRRRRSFRAIPDPNFKTQRRTVS
jgi:hypothetical protein